MVAKYETTYMNYCVLLIDRYRSRFFQRVH